MNISVGVTSVPMFTHSRCRVVALSSALAFTLDGSTDRRARACSSRSRGAFVETQTATAAKTKKRAFIVPLSIQVLPQELNRGRPRGGSGRSILSLDRRSQEPLRRARIHVHLVRLAEALHRRVGGQHGRHDPGVVL